MNQVASTVFRLYSLNAFSGHGRSTFSWMLIVKLFQLCYLLHLGFCTDPVFSPQSLSDSYGNAANNASQINWAPLPKGLPYKTTTKYNDGGLTPWYNFAKHFVNTVQPNSFPYDIAKGIKDGFSSYLSEHKDVVIKYEIGFIVCLVLGILFAVAMPIIGAIFCCCRLCGNCGGEMTQKSSSNKCTTKMAYMLVLAVLTFFLSVGMICTYVNNDRMELAIDEVTKNVHTNIDDMNNYMTNTVNELKYISLTNFNFTIQVIKRDLDNMGYLVGIPVREMLGTEAGINTVFTNVLGFNSLINSVSVSLFAVNTSTSRLKMNGKILANELSRVKGNIDTAKKNTTSCIGCNGYGLNTSSLRMDANFSALPDITNELNKMQNVLSTDLSTTVSNAQKEFIDIPQRVTNDSKPTVTNVKKLLDDFSVTINDEVTKVNKLPNDLSKQTDSFKKTFDDYENTAEDYDKYRWIAGVVLTCTILIVVGLQALGIVFGCLGHKSKALPSERSGLSNFGGLLLMAATGFIFIFSWLLMLLTSISFLFAGNMEKLLCEPLTDPDYTVFKKLIDEPGAVFGKPNEYYLGSVVLGNGSIPLTMSGVLKGCQQNGPAYTVMKLDSKFSLDTVTDYRKKIDIETEINSINVDFSTINILTPELEKQLRDFSDAVQLDYNGFRAELGKNTTKADLLQFANDLDTAAALSSEPSKTELSTAASDLRSIHSGIFTTVKSDQAKLLTDINTLETNTNSIPGSVNNTLSSVTRAENILKANGSAIVKQKAVSYANRVLGVADSYANNTLKSVKSDIGKCLPVWNLWESMVHISLCKYIIDTFNGFWFSIGFCLFFMVPSIIFDVKLAKHMRRMELLDTYDATHSTLNGKSWFGNSSSAVLAPTSQQNHSNNRNQSNDRSKHIAMNNLSQTGTRQKETMQSSNIPVSHIANMENRKHSSPVCNTNNSINDNENGQFLEVPATGVYPKASYNMSSNTYQYNNTAYVPDNYSSDSKLGYDSYPYHDDVTYSPVDLPPPTYTPEHVNPPTTLSQYEATNYPEVVYATVNKPKHKSSDMYGSNGSSNINSYESNGLANFNSYDANGLSNFNSYATNNESKYNYYEADSLKKDDKYNLNLTSYNNPYETNGSPNYDPYNSNVSYKYEHAETQAHNGDNQYYLNNRGSDQSQYPNDVQNGSSQNSPANTMVKNSPANTMTQPKSILKNKVTFILPPEKGENV